MNLKAGTIALLVGVGAVLVGCGGEAGDAAAGDGDQASDTETARLVTADFSVDGMTCGGCALATEISVRKLDGVSSVDASYDEEADEGSCSVRYDPEVVGTDAIAQAIRDAGFEPTLSTTPSDA